MQRDNDTTATEHAPIARRTALRTLGAAAAGGVAGLFVLGGPAEALTGTMQYGTSNDSGTEGTSLSSSVAGATLTVDSNNSSINATAIAAHLTGAGVTIDASVTATTVTARAIGAKSLTSLGYPIVAEGGQAQLLLAGTLPNPRLSSDEHTAGELLYDEDGNLWICISSGVPGSWRSLGGASSAGAFHAITPSRVYDSRRPTSNRLGTGEERGVFVADKVDKSTGATVEEDIVPAGATAISYTLTVVNTLGSNGFLAVNPGNISEVSASTINWSASGLTIANSSVVGITKFRDINVICGGTNTSCNFIIDVLGYYL